MNATTRFSDRVDNYVKYRPGYPSGVIDVLRDEIGLTPQSIVADLGSGTGLSAKLFLDNGNIVYGVEPNADMRAAGEAYLRDYPHFRSVDGTAEATTLADASVDIVIAAQAFHWFNVPIARVEAKRVLKADGYGVLLWNDRLTDTTPFLRAFEALLLEFGTDYAQVNHRNAQAIDRAAITQFFGHTAWQLRTMPSAQLFDYAGLEGRLLSSSYAPLAGHPQHEPMLERLHTIFGEHQVDGLVQFAYETQVYFGKLA